jgi:PTS system N-acetylglucosamine-specific IIC component
MLSVFQRVGRALMMPIAVLPAAALLLRLGTLFLEEGWLPGLETLWSVMQAGGQAVFDNLPLIFAIGVAIGFTEGAGAAGLAAGVGYVILKAITDISTAIEGSSDLGVLGGIIMGLIAAVLYKRYKDVHLPDYLAFFGGRRFVPIVTAFAAILLGLVAFYVWPPIGNTIDSFGNWIVGAGALGVFVYGIANRALLPFGLHHIINALVWFEFGTFEPSGGGEAVHGDLSRYFAGDPEAGIFMAGWYFIMLFALPAACFAMYRAATESNRKATGAGMGSAGFTSFLTGVTEPIEFSFMFVAPILYAAHALLCGVALVVAETLGIKIGFGFSAGMIDYIVAYGLATNALLIFPVGLLFGVVYFFMFGFAIRQFNLATPGREPEEPTERTAARSGAEPATA